MATAVQHERLASSTLSAADRPAVIGRIVRVAGGNFLEMYDFIVYGYYATYIADTFFPVGNQFASLMLSLTTFGVGYLMRPLGALVLGAYIDRRGRRQGLIVTLGLMAIGTFTIAATPGYASIGLLAPLIVVVGRLLQGLSAGVELGGVSVYLSEIATPGNRGFYTSWQSGSQQIAVIFTALVGIALTTNMSAAQMTAWGWRVPLFVGCLIIPLIFWMRRSLEETEAFRTSRHARSAGEVFALVVENWPLVLIGTMLSVLTTTIFYLITAYTPTFGRQALHLDAGGNLLVTLCVGFSNLFWVVFAGWVGDRIGRRPLLIAAPFFCLVTAYPAMAWLAAEPTFFKLLIVELWFSLLFGVYNGAMIPSLVEMMPLKVRTAAFSLAFSLATAIFGGFTPAIATYLIEVTGSRAAPGLWLSFAAAISLTGALLVGRPRSTNRATA
jgi:MFS transporter, MHS family, citrate/tricarballylate:H+ symporter